MILENSGRSRRLNILQPLWLLACLALNSAVTCAGAGVVVTAEKLLTTILELEDAATGLETTVPMDTKEQPQSEGV